VLLAGWLYVKYVLPWLGSIPPPTREPSAWIHRALRFLEHNFVILPAGIIGGIVALIFPPMFAVLGVCFLLGLHRSGAVAGQSRLKQALTYLLLAAGSFLGLSLLNTAIQNKLTANNISFAKLVASFSGKPEPSKKDVSGTAPPAFVTLKDLFASDWSYLPGYYMESDMLFVGGKTRVAWKLYGDFRARSKFLVLFFDEAVAPNNVWTACVFTADNYSFFSDSMDAEVDVIGKAPDDSSVTHFSDMVFSKRVFVYYADPEFSLAMRSQLDTMYASRGLSIVFRDSQYVAAHQDNHPEIRKEKLVSNSFILPNPALPKGWIMKVINKHHP
jgi:hypothetical protein